MAQPVTRSGPPVGSIVGFLCLAAAIYWLFVLIGVIPESPKAVAVSFLLVFLVAGVGRLGWV